MAQQPAYRAYTVIKRGDGQDDFWLAIGAAFAHQSGDGFNIVLQALLISSMALFVGAMFWVALNADTSFERMLRAAALFCGALVVVGAQGAGTGNHLMQA